MTLGSAVLGLGNDIIEIQRVRESYELHGEKFLNRLFSKAEQEYCLQFKDPFPRLAARFSAKEAIVKALGVGFGEEIAWLDIEISKDSKGKPLVSFSDKINKNFNNPVVLLSISHCNAYAATTAIWVSS